MILADNKPIVVAGFDPPSTSNLGWSILSTDTSLTKTARLIDAGIFKLPDDEPERLIAIRDFVLDLLDKYRVNVMCFERSTGKGFAVIRSIICENTGVIKLVGASYGAELAEIHTSTMGLAFTGYGGGKDKEGKSKKTRTKQKARDIFYPGQSFRTIAPSGSGENFEHLADSIGLCATYLLKLGIPIEGPGGRIEPQNINEPKGG